jgi:uracil-DNA glycosylase
VAQATEDGHARVLQPWTSLVRDMRGCIRCRLHEDRTQVVVGDGAPDADLVLVGTAPGRHEDLAGEPFVGAVGNLLDNVLTDHGLSHDDIYLTTVVKCRPPGNRTPEVDEVVACSTWLKDQLAHVRPRVVITLGELPAQLLLNRPPALERLAGYRLPWNGITLIPAYAPEEALRGNARAMSILQRSVRTAKGILDGSVPPADAPPLTARGAEGQ